MAKIDEQVGIAKALVGDQLDMKQLEALCSMSNVDMIIEHDLTENEANKVRAHCQQEMYRMRAQGYSFVTLNQQEREAVSYSKPPTKTMPITEHTLRKIIRKELLQEARKAAQPDSAVKARNVVKKIAASAGVAKNQMKAKRANPPAYYMSEQAVALFIDDITPTQYNAIINGIEAIALEKSERPIDAEANPKVKKFFSDSGIANVHFAFTKESKVDVGIDDYTSMSTIRAVTADVKPMYWRVQPGDKLFSVSIRFTGPSKEAFEPRRPLRPFE
jgi:hypothetical protein